MSIWSASALQQRSTHAGSPALPLGLGLWLGLCPRGRAGRPSAAPSAQQPDDWTSRRRQLARRHRLGGPRNYSSERQYSACFLATHYLSSTTIFPRVSHSPKGQRRGVQRSVFLLAPAARSPLRPLLALLAGLEGLRVRAEAGARRLDVRGGLEGVPERHLLGKPGGSGRPEKKTCTAPSIGP